jgi:peptide/nickel transport system substrate-binding protein
MAQRRGKRFEMRSAFGRRRFLLGAGGVAAGAVALGSVGCGGDDNRVETIGGPPATPSAAASGSEPRQGGTLRLLGGPLGTLPDPHLTKSTAEALLWQWLGNLLVRYSPTTPYAVEGDLAAKLPEIPGDGLTFIFQLRPEARWHNRAPVNGRAVTAEDVKLSFERIKALGANSPRSGNYTNVDSITAVDSQTLKFKLKAPQADLLNLIADQYDIVLPKELTSRGASAITTIGDAIASGPYELTSYDSGHKASVKRRADGPWKPNTAWLDGADLLDVRDDGQRANGLLATQGDLSELPPVLARVFESRSDFTVLRTPSAARECVLVNCTVAHWKDPKVRLAASRAIDRRNLYASVFQGEGTAGGAVSPAAKFWALPDADLAALPGYGDRTAELTEAKALMSAAGFATGFDDTIHTVAAHSLDLVTAAIVSDLAQLGIRLKVQTVGDDLAALTDLARQGSFTLMATLLLAGIYPDAQLYVYHRSGGAANFGKFSAPALDAKLDKQRALYDQAQRLALVQEIQRDLANAPGPLWLGAHTVETVVSNRAHGVVAPPFLAGSALAESAWLG